MNIVEAQAILNVTPPFTESLIKSAYRRAAFKYHPDRGGDSHKFTQANEARDILMESLNHYGRTYQYRYEERQRAYQRARKEEKLKKSERNTMEKFRRHFVANRVLVQTQYSTIQFKVDENGRVYIEIHFGKRIKVPSVKNKGGWRRLNTAKVPKSLLKDLTHYIRTGAGWPKHFENN